MSIAKLKTTMPSQHHAALDTALAGVDAAKQAQVGSFITNLIAFLKSMGITVNWQCILTIIPQIIAAFGNPALWATVIAAYFACANSQPPTP